MSWRRAITLLVFAGLFCLVAPPLTAANTAAPAPAGADIIYPNAAGARTAAATGASSGYSAVVVVALLMAGAGGWLFWRGRMAPGRPALARKLAIAETKSLGNRQYLVVASYEDKKFLLGVCPGRIDLLTALDSHPPGKSP